ncbi:hypothetical protein ACH4PU_11755 [Streptomyces sp. NPDC021100]|uniref:hypothetical protein n=1 Tax=Streptomyces sp. NPDC021100 TaxID=3365114 RepID=UPI00378F3981
MTERGDAPPQERLERLRASLRGTSTSERDARFATQGHTNVLIGASLHAADRLRQNKTLTDLERWLLDVLKAVLPEQEVKDWGREYREAVQELGDKVALVPPVISALPVGTGFGIDALGRVLPDAGREHRALPNTSVVDRETVAAGGSVDSPSFVEGLSQYRFGATVLERPRPTADTPPARSFRVKLEMESFRCIRAVGDQWGGKDEIYWCSSVGSDKLAGPGFISQEFGKMTAGRSRTFDPARRTIFDGQVSKGTLLCISCWEADQSPPAWVRALKIFLTELSGRLFDHWGWILVGLLPGGYPEMLIGIAAEIAKMFAWVINNVRNDDDLSCARTILLDQYDLALMARGKLRNWDFNGDGHHVLTVKYSGDTVPFPAGTLEYAVRTGDNWGMPVTLPWDSMTAPVLATYKGKLHAMYVRPKDGAVMWTVRDAATWSEPKRIHSWSVHYTPALCAFAGKLHCVLVGKDDVLRWATTSDGISWTETTKLPWTAERAPAMTNGGGLNTVLWVNHVKDQRLNTDWYRSVGSQWDNSWADNLGWVVNRPPAMAWYQGVPWRVATGADQFLYTAVGEYKLVGTKTRPNWINRGQISKWRSTHGPALAVHQGKLWIFLRDMDGYLRYSTYYNSWAETQHVSPQKLMAPMDEPSATSHNDKLYVMYRRNPSLGGGNPT